MGFSIGLDIGGSKIAGAVFGTDGNPLAQQTVPTPKNYSEFFKACGELIQQFDKTCGQKAAIGIGIAGIVDSEAGSVDSVNIPYLKDQALRSDLERLAGRLVAITNDAACAAWAEALEGAGKGFRSVFGLTLGTGVGGAQIIDGKLIANKAGMAGEIGHRPLPYREASDGPAVTCGCGLQGCIDKSISGPSLARLYKYMTGREIEDPRHVVTSLAKKDADALRVLDQYYTTVAKAMTEVIESFEPDIIVVSGGLSGLPGLYDEVPKRWGRYSEVKNAGPKFVPAKLGAVSGMLGAALIAKGNS